MPHSVILPAPLQSLNPSDPVLPWQLPKELAWRGRIAPTPSGHLHLGNLVNFLLTWVSLRALDGEVGLRIDDMDGVRTRPTYIEEVFVTLDWLGIDWDFGPTGVAEQAEYSFATRLPILRELASTLLERQLAFVCDCSRKALLARGALEQYDGFCHARALPWQPGRNLLRSDTPLSSANPLGETVLWRRDDLPSYQLASTWHDERDRINLLIRGEDLLDSSLFQKTLAGPLGWTTFQTAHFYHHPLLTDSKGHKLSKSSGSQAHALHQSGLKAAQVVQTAAHILGFSEQQSRHLGQAYDLLHLLQDQTL